MSQEPLITVIVPAFNAAASLERCVISVLGQTLNNLEIIIVDDGSVDGTGALADTLASRYRQVRVIHQTNEGLSGARNSGIDGASGSRLYFLDADDYIAPDTLEKLSSVMDETDTAFVAGGLVKVDKNGEVISRILVEPSTVDERGFWEGFKAACGSEEYSEYIVSAGKLFDRRIFKHERFDVGKIHEDEFIIHRLVSVAGKVAFADSDGYKYVQSEGSIMHSPRPSASLDAAEAFLLRASYFERHGWYDLSFISLCLARGVLSYYFELVKNGHIDVRYKNLRAQWLVSIQRVSRLVHGNVKSKLANLFFTVSPSLYITVKGNGK